LNQQSFFPSERSFLFYHIFFLVEIKPDAPFISFDVFVNSDKVYLFKLLIFQSKLYKIKPTNKTP